MAHRMRIKSFLYWGLWLGVIGAIQPVSATVYPDAIRVTPLDLQVGVDLNRDGVISFEEMDANGKRIASPDQTTPERPFRFWLNDDYDVVLQYGNHRFDKTECTADIRSDPKDGRQVCEQEDLLDTGTTNVANGSKSIESLRDLEDFVALAIRIQPWQAGMSALKDVKVKLRTSGFSINVFEGKWGQPRTGGQSTTLLSGEHVTDRGIAREQVQAQWISALPDTYGLPQSATRAGSRELKLKWFDVYKDGVARLLFEGITGSEACLTQPDTCFLEVTIEDEKGHAIISKKLYMTLHPVKAFYDHYTVGVGQSDAPSITPLRVHDAVFRLTPETQENRDKYIVFVHGWRMKNAERVNFAETALKRLYWSGYDGKFGFFSWPTDWFYKPSYLSRGESALKALADPQNYSRSEAIARRTAPALTQWLEQLGHGVRVFAHSMGNVVVSEALRQFTGTQLMTTYVATQAAEVAGAYDPTAQDMDVDLSFLQDVVPGCSGRPAFEVAWRCLNNDNGNIQDIPPDKYRYTVPNPHDFDATQWGTNYYSGIAAKAGRIVNFNNFEDAALDAWRLQQVTKPDNDGLPGGNDSTWEYEATKDSTQPGFFFDHFWVDPPGGVDPVNHYQELVWDAPDVNGRGNSEILAHIIPGRTLPLGQAGDATGEIGSSVDMNSKYTFRTSNYDHSAQFLSDFSSREVYWRNLIEELRLGN